MEHWGLTAPASGEVEAAKILVEFFEHSLDGVEKESSIDASQVSALVETFTENFQDFDWRIERMPSPMLFTSDCPVVYWRPRSPQDRFEGIGLENATEVWFAVDPQNLLVMTRSSGKRGLWSVSKKRLLFVNREIASRSFETTIGTQQSFGALDSLSLSPRKPALRFNIGPGIRIGPRGKEEPMGDILHQWVPPYDEIEILS